MNYFLQKRTFDSLKLHKSHNIIWWMRLLVGNFTWLFNEISSVVTIVVLGNTQVAIVENIPNILLKFTH